MTLARGICRSERRHTRSDPQFHCSPRQTESEKRSISARLIATAINCSLSARGRTSSIDAMLARREPGSGSARPTRGAARNGPTLRRRGRGQGRRQPSHGWRYMSRLARERPGACRQRVGGRPGGPECRTWREGLAPLQAAAWGIWLQGEAGRRVSKTMAPIGYLARELAPLAPRLMRGIR